MYGAFSAFLFVGVLLAILEKAGVISPVYSYDGTPKIGVGTVAAGYQNFIICIEMFFAAIGFWFAFTYKPYIHNPSAMNNHTVSLQSISSNLKETINPKDIVVDALHNFHPSYQEYIQHENSIPQEELECYREHQSNSVPPRDRENYQHQMLEVPKHLAGATVSAETNPNDSTNRGANKSTVEVEMHPSVMPGLKHSKFTEKTNLLNPGDD